MLNMSENSSFNILKISQPKRNIFSIHIIKKRQTAKIFKLKKERGGKKITHPDRTISKSTHFILKIYHKKVA